MAQVVGECKHQTSFKSRDSLRNGRINITPVIVRAFQKAVYMAHAKDVVEDNLGPILSLEVDFLVPRQNISSFVADCFLRTTKRPKVTRLALDRNSSVRGDFTQNV